MGKPAEDFTTPTIEQHDHERSDARIRPLALFLAGLVGSVVFVGLVVWLLFDIFLATINSQASSSRPEPVPHGDTGHPVLQVVPSHDMQVLRERQERTLSSTEWINRKQGIARIPIDAAMEQVASNGLPTWPAVVEHPPARSSTPNLPPKDQPVQTEVKKAAQ
jgi:hypothetical protein